jgi:hypothetical protein
MNRRTFRDAQRERETATGFALAVLVSVILATIATLAGF